MVSNPFHVTGTCAELVSTRSELSRSTIESFEAISALDSAVGFTEPFATSASSEICESEAAVEGSLASPLLLARTRCRTGFARSITRFLVSFGFCIAHGAMINRVLGFEHRAAIRSDRMFTFVVAMVIARRALEFPDLGSYIARTHLEILQISIIDFV
jgi:hypothetical protein